MTTAQTVDVWATDHGLVVRAVTRGIAGGDRHLGLVERVGTRYKATYNGLLVPTPAGPRGLYATQAAAITALVARRAG